MGKSAEMSDMTDLWIFFPQTWLKNPGRDSWTKEYSECCLVHAWLVGLYFAYLTLYLHIPGYGKLMANGY